MAIFDYKGRDARAEVIEAFALARYAQIEAFGVLGDALGAVTGNVQAFGLPEGWRELTAAELRVSPEKVDAEGFFTGATSTAAQAKILGFVGENGAIERVSVSFAGTNSLDDVPAYLDLAQGRYIEEFRYLLNATASYAASVGLTGADVVVNGYSLGGAAVDILAEKTGEISGGFYDTSNFFGFSSPTIFDDSGRILNFGAENDVVYRIIGDSDDSVSEGLMEAVINEDQEFGSSADNIVLFNDLYASPLSPYGPFSIVNLFGGWNAHITGILDSAVERIAGSTFYDLIEIDSAVIVSQLSDATRGTIWVEDAFRTTSSHFGDPAFILGTESGDRLRDGRAGDFLDGFAGNDRFDLSTGNDTVAGGVGNDTVMLDGTASQYQTIRLSDGTLFLAGGATAYGLKELSSVEAIEFGSGLGTSRYAVDANGLDARSFFSRDIGYSSHREGSNSADTLSGSSTVDRLFGRSGDDRLFGAGGNDLLHGGDGEDTLFGQAGSDQLYGAAGDDILGGGLGDDFLSGGVGNDLFDFSQGAGGRDLVTDFDHGVEGDDALLLSASLFQTASAALESFQQVAADAVLSFVGGSVVLQNVDVASLSLDDVLLA